MAKNVDYTGMKFGELTVVAKMPKDKMRKDRHTLYECVCSCGNKVIIPSNAIKARNACRNCNSRKYGGNVRTRYYRLYRIWLGMRNRCNCSTSKNFRNYGERGIGICDEWNDFNNFKEWAYKSGYSDDLNRKECSLDRIDVNGNYEPQNCRWVNSGVQALNKRRVQNKSGARGVWITEQGHYQAVISKNNKRIGLGTYNSVEEAMAARRWGEKEYFGISLDD